MSGPITKYAIITGGSSGLGLHFAKALYAYGGFSIILGCRSKQKAEKAIEIVKNCTIPEERKNQARDVRFIEVDLVCSDSINKFFSDFSAICKAEQLHLLVNNAGIMNHPYELTTSHVEVHFATNFLGHFMLTNLLLELMADSGRILNVTSGYYQRSHGIPDDSVLTSPHPVGGRTPSDYYALSKLACCLHVVAFHERLRANNSGIKIVAIQPGFVRGTELGRHTNAVLRFLATPLIWMFSKNLDQGISGMVHCSTCPEDELESGRLYFGSTVIEYNDMTVNTEAAQDLWQLGVKLESLAKCRVKLQFED